MRPGDLDRIMEIEESSFGSDAYDRKLFAAYLRNCGEFALVAEDRRIVRAYLIGCARGERAELVSIAVDPTVRGKGAASALIEGFFRRLRTRGIIRVGLMVKCSNQAAQSLYRKHGFVKVRRVFGYYEDGSDGLLMARAFHSRSAG